MAVVTMPDHRVPHDFNSKDVCKWCNNSRVYHESGIPTPFCEAVPKYLVDAWKAEQAAIEARAQTLERAFRQGGRFA